MRFKKLKEIIASITLSATFVTSLNCNFAGAIKTGQEVIDLLSLINFKCLADPFDEYYYNPRNALSLILPYFKSIDSKKMSKAEILQDLEKKVEQRCDPSVRDHMNSFFKSLLNVNVSDDAIERINENLNGHAKMVEENLLRAIFCDELGTKTTPEDDLCKFTLGLSNNLFQKYSKIPAEEWSTGKAEEELAEGNFYLAIYCYISIKKLSDKSPEEILQVLRRDANNFLKKSERLPVYEEIDKNIYEIYAKIEKERRSLNTSRNSKLKRPDFIFHLLYSIKNIELTTEARPAQKDIDELRLTFDILLELTQSVLNRKIPDYMYGSTETKQRLGLISLYLMFLATERESGDINAGKSTTGLVLQSLRDYERWIKGYLEFCFL